jgi:hypothetical protein
MTRQVLIWHDKYEIFVQEKSFGNVVVNVLICKENDY